MILGIYIADWEKVNTEWSGRGGLLYCNVHDPWVIEDEAQTHDILNIKFLHVFHIFYICHMDRWTYKNKIVKELINLPVERKNKYNWDFFSQALVNANNASGHSVILGVFRN